MSGRNLAYLDLSALPTVGPALLSARPTFVWAADGRRVLWANAAGVAFFGAAELDSLLDRRFSDTLPATSQIAGFARVLPKGVTRMERIRFAAGGRLQNLAALCTRIALADNSDAVRIALEPPRGPSLSLVERAEQLADAVVSDDCLVAILDMAGEVVAASGGHEALTAAEGAIEALVSGINHGEARLLKRVIRIDDVRRPAGIVRFEQDDRRFHLLMVGPAERVMLEPEPEPVETPAAIPAAVEIPAALVAPEEPAPTAPEPVAAADIPAEKAEPVLAQPAAEIARARTMADIVEAVSETAVAPEAPAATEAAVAEEAPAAEPTSAEPDGAPEPVAMGKIADRLEETAAVAAEGDLAAAGQEADADEEADAAEEADPAKESDAGEASDFRFEPPTGPVRFVFQMDAESRFSLVSPEFAAVVGPLSAGIVGVAWREVAAKRDLDPQGTIAALIARRDTWSGVTLSWPVDGSDQRVSVDLAALPAFSRDRAFEGYRGFGVLRPVESRREPPVQAPKIVAVPPARAPVAEPSNVVRLPRPANLASDAERLSMPEQDAFRRIAVALGGKVEEPSAATAPSNGKPKADEPEPLAAGEPAPAAPVAERPDGDAPSAANEAAADVATPETPEPVVETPPDEPAPPFVAPVEPEPVVAVPPRALAETPAPAPVAPDRQLVEDLAAAGQKIAELEAILDTATDGVAVVDADGCIVRINRSAEALFGVDSAHVAGLPFTHLLAEESRKSALDYLDGLAQNGVASLLNDGREVIGRVPQGGLIPLFMTMGRLGETGKFCAVLRDITQWKNAEEELISARRAAETASVQKSDFLAKVSHEIRTPLNAIIGFSEVMMEERFGPIGTERYKEYLRDINVSGAHLMSLLNDLLDLSKIEAGKLDLNFEAVALNEIVMECVAMMQPQANRERIIIRTSLSSQVPSIVADPRSIRQIVLNLVSNAVKFTLAGGQVIVSTALEERGEVTLRIRDTGIGMSEKDVETALMPFRQVATSAKHRSDGTGLGLPLTKALVEANRAAFQIDSAVGQGTLIRVTFPATRVLAG